MYTIDHTSEDCQSFFKASSCFCIVILIKEMIDLAILHFSSYVLQHQYSHALNQNSQPNGAFSRCHMTRCFSVIAIA